MPSSILVEIEREIERLRRRGILGGDHVARVMIIVPATRTPRQRECLEELAKSGG